MPGQINFLAERQKGISKQQLQDIKWLKIAGVAFGLTVVLAIAIFGIFFYYLSQLNSVTDQEKAVRAQIIGNKENEMAYLTYVRKLNTLATLYKDRQDKNDIIAYFSSLFGSDVVVTGIEFDQKDKLLHFKVQSRDVFVLRRVLSVVNSSQVKEKFPALAISDLTRNNTAAYEVTISVPITKLAGAS